TKSIQALKPAEQLNPGNYEVRYDLGYALTRASRTQEAIEQLLAAARINPNAAEAHYQLALALEKSGEEARSRQEMEKFQTLKKGENQEITAGSLNNDGNRLLEEGKIEEAVETYRKAVELDTNMAQWHYDLAQALRWR